MSHRAWRPLLILVLAALMLAPGARAQQPSKELQELRETSQAFYRAGDYAQALRFAERALPLVIRTYGPDHEQTGLQYYSLGLTAEKAGNLAAAQRYYAETVRVREKVYGVRGPSVAEALEALGAVHIKQGRPGRGRADLPARARAQAGADRIQSSLSGERPFQPRRCGAGTRQLAGGARRLSPGAEPAGRAGHIAGHRQGDRRRRDPPLSRHLRRALSRRLADERPGRQRSQRAVGRDVPGRATGVDHVGGLGAGQDDGTHRCRRDRPWAAHPPGAGPVRAHPAPQRRRP